MKIIHLQGEGSKLLDHPLGCDGFFMSDELKKKLFFSAQIWLLTSMYE